MKSVSSSQYDKKYYLSRCSGFRQFRSSFGKNLEPRLKLLTKRIKISKDAAVLDLGCGRGEFSLWAAKYARRVSGIDYSPQAIKLAKKALGKSSKEIRTKVSFRRMNAKRLYFASRTFDTVVSFEVWEHLYPHEQKTVLQEIMRVLKPGGALIVHTEPNRVFSQYTYRWWCYPLSCLLIFLNSLLRGKKYPNLPKWDRGKLIKDRLLHVNEPTYFSLKSLFCSPNVKVKIISPNVIWTKPKLSWKDAVYNFLVFGYPLSCFWPFNIIWGQDFLITVKKP